MSESLLTKPFFAIVWYYLNIAAYRLLSVTLLSYLPKPVLVPLAKHLFRTIMWWEEYWVDYYLNNGMGYFENVRRIKNNPFCLDTTLMAYEYVCGHPEEFGITLLKQ
jgi:hypothetical protein